MDSEEENIDKKLGNLLSEGKQRPKSIIVSSINDKIFIHTEIKISDDLQLEEGINLNKNDSAELNKNCFIDINTQTSSLNPNEINCLTFNQLLTKKNCQDESEIDVDHIDIQESKDQNFRLHHCAADFCIKERIKHQRLTLDQKKFLNLTIDESGLTSKQISQKYKISQSLIYKIRRSSWQHLTDKRNIDIFKICDFDKQEIISEMIEYSKQAQEVFTAKDMADHINLKFNSSFKVEFIRKFMRNKVNLRYKKIKSRPSNVNFMKIGSTRRLFAVMFSKVINDNTLVINIDESSININLKSKYSWIFKGRSHEAKNVQFSGSLNVIMAVCSNGCWFSLFSNEAINSAKFVLFINNFSKWLIQQSYFGFSDRLILLDNCSIHKSKQTKEALLKTNLKVLYLSPYSPDFAPVEMGFSILKQNIVKECKNQMLKLNLKDSYQTVVRALKSLNQKQLNNFSCRCMQKLKDIYLAKTFT